LLNCDDVVAPTTCHPITGYPPGQTIYGTYSNVFQCQFPNVYAAGGDPIAWRANGTAVLFSLPLETPMQLIRTNFGVLHGVTFPGSEHEQWFNRFMLTDPSGKMLIQFSIKEDLLNVNKTGLPRDAFESLNVFLGDSQQPLFRRTTLDGRPRRMTSGDAELEIDIAPMGHYWSVKQLRIGRAQRECVEVLFRPDMHFYVCSSPADEYFGRDWEKSIRYAHLDIVMMEMAEDATGIFPELWGLQPLSDATQALLDAKPNMKPGRLFDAASPEAQDPFGSIV
jgi:hypothetical protein